MLPGGILERVIDARSAKLTFFSFEIERRITHNIYSLDYPVILGVKSSPFKIHNQLMNNVYPTATAYQ